MPYGKLIFKRYNFPLDKIRFKRYNFPLRVKKIFCSKFIDMEKFLFDGSFAFNKMFKYAYKYMPKTKYNH